MNWPLTFVGGVACYLGERLFLGCRRDSERGVLSVEREIDDIGSRHRPRQDGKGIQYSVKRHYTSYILRIRYQGGNLSIGGVKVDAARDTLSSSTWWS